MELRPIGCGQRRIAFQLFTGFAAVCSLAILSLSADAQAPAKRLQGSISPLLQTARLAGKPQPAETIQLSLSFPLRNQAQLEALAQKVSDPTDPSYGHYLTNAQFTAQFGPTQADYDAVTAYARSQGLTITDTSSNRSLLGVEGSVQNIQAAFGVTLKQYQLADGSVVRAPSADPVLPAAIADKLEGIIGMDTSAVRRPHNIRKLEDPLAFLNPPSLFSPLGAPPVGDTPPGAGSPPSAGTPILPAATGSGPGNGYTPSDIKTVYGFNGTPWTGAGQTLALYELDGYTARDITAYENAYGLPNVPLQNVLLDGYRGTAGGAADEVTLDIELQIALAPGISKILVYEAPNSSKGAIDLFNRIATDNLAKSISTSWGLPENYASTAELGAENKAFLQMAMQGQSIFDASGDNGSKDDGVTLSVDDPGGQPYMTAVGGTTLTTTIAGGSRNTEVAWSGSGGGISRIWYAPLYQSGLTPGFQSMRNTPDLALNADPATGYSIYFRGRWTVFGGTSCAAPLWSAIAALSNQQRVASGKPTLGFVNPYVYRIARNNAQYAADFFDIIVGNNGSATTYPAMTKYDLVTGLGSINSGIALLNDLNNFTIPTPVELLVNGGFENGAKKPQPWIATLSVINNFSQEDPFEGSWKAWLCGYGSPHTDTLKYPSVTIPNTANTATLSFALHIDTQEDPLSIQATDTMSVQILSANGTPLENLATYSNLNFADGFTVKGFDVTAYKGQAIQILFTATENASRGTSFVVDAVSLVIQ